MKLSNGVLQNTFYSSGVRVSKTERAGHIVVVSKLTSGCQNGSMVGVGTWNLRWSWRTRADGLVVAPP